MGVKIYYIVAAAVLVFGILMPQEGPRKKWYIILMALLHSFVCGFRYMYLTGDLRKYAWGYMNVNTDAISLSSLWNNGRNPLFYALRTLFSVMSDGDFQVFLLFIAIVTEIFLAILIYRYAPRPWLSYFVWNCLAFYVFGFNAIKQALAMAVVMWAACAILERRPWKYLCIMAIAFLIHAPALCFLPAYWLTKRTVNAATIWAAIITAIVIYLLRSPIINLVSPLYYEDETFVMGGSLGLRFYFILGLLALGILIKGFEDPSFQIVFHLIIVAAILQMFSVFDNVFTRLADYYFQFSVLYIPMLFYKNRSVGPETAAGHAAPFALQPRLNSLAVLGTTAMLMLYYYQTQLSVIITNASDNYLNFRFMWEV